MDFYFEKYDKADNERLISSTVIDPRLKKLTFLSREGKKANEYYSIAADIIKQENLVIEEKEEKENIKFQLFDSEDDKKMCKTPLQEIKKYINYPRLSSISEFYKNYAENLPRLSLCVEIF